MSSARMRPARPVAHPLHALAAGLAVTLRGETTVQVTGVTADSRAVEPGDLFAALPGARTHGARWVAGARAAGAVAVLTDPAGRDLLDADPALHDLPLLVADDPAAVLGPVAAALHDHPAAGLTAFAVTGTNGKTTTTFLVDHVLRALGRRTGLIGTVVTRSGDRELPSRLTTPGADELQAVLATMREDGVTALAMEVSSHALAQHRVDGLVADVAGFTNLSQDHLDFHHDMASYLTAKQRLFTPALSRRAVVVVDDAAGRAVAAQALVPVATLRTDGGGDGGGDADWWVADMTPTGVGSSFALRHRDGRELRTAVALPGRFNVADAALALAMVAESGVALAELAAALPDGLRVAVPGRMEVVAVPGVPGPRVVVDFAHNADALVLALDALREVTPGRLVVVFGATGDRDAGKRPVMGQVAVAHADRVVVTDDDPHDEDPARIRAAVLAGARAAAAGAGDGAAGPVDGGGTRGAVEVLEVAPRAAAIRAAIADARDEDTVLVAGRGHETWQELAGVDLPLDDRVEARAALADRAGRPDLSAAHDRKDAR